MKTHALIGAEILARMHFPELVTDIVKTHHEKWDGSGYPFGVSGDDIPIGARILSAVDCLDALASDRPYRAALPLDEAMARATIPPSFRFCSAAMLNWINWRAAP